MSDGQHIEFDFDPHSLPADLLQAIGLMVASSAQTEYVVQEFIGSILGIDDVETLAVALHMGGPMKNNVAKAIMQLNGASIEIVDQVDELLDAIEAAAAKSNIIVHNNFAKDPDTGKVFSYRINARGSLKMELSPVDVEQIEQAATEVYEAGLNLMRFMQAYNLAPRRRGLPTLPAFDRGKRARQKRRECREGD